MSKQIIKQLIESKTTENGLIETGVKGVKLFYVTSPVACAPAIYEPAVIAIVSGIKEAILDGEAYVYDCNKYMCCTMCMPVEAGVSKATPEEPLVGVYISLDTNVMTELVIEMENATGGIRTPKSGALPKGLELASWSKDFEESLLRLLQLGNSVEDTLVLGESRLREVYYAILKGEAGKSVRRAFGVGNEIAKAIEYLSSHINEAVTIEDLCNKIGMSRAVFHRKFKQATTMSPIQFIKAMRLNKAAVQISEGVNISEAAFEVGYMSTTQFSREFKRMFGQSPRNWRLSYS